MTDLIKKRVSDQAGLMAVLWTCCETFLAGVTIALPLTHPRSIFTYHLTLKAVLAQPAP